MTQAAILDYRNDAASDTASWSNWQTRKQIGLFAALSLWSALWVPTTLFLTLMGASHILLPPALILIPIFWFGTGIAVLIFLRLFMHETIRVRDDVLILTLKGAGFRHTREIRREHIKCLSLGSDSHESVQTLNLFVSKGIFTRRIILAYTVHVEEKIALYNWLKSAMQQRDYRCEFRKKD